MSQTFFKTVIRDRWQFIHWCDDLVSLLDQGDPVDRDTVCIIYGLKERWYIRDKNRDAYFRVSYCPGCGKELAEQFAALQTLGRLDPSAIARIPEKKGLEG